MERNYLSNRLKDHGIRSRSYSYTTTTTTTKLKDPLNHISQSNVREDQDCVGVGGYSWASKSYNCSFCNREFTSAQALGGHMNVHRRDRARLRQSPPIMEIGHCPNTATTSFNLNLLPSNFDPNPSNVSPPLTCTTFSSLVSTPSPPSPLFPCSPCTEEKKLINRNLNSTLLIDPLSKRSPDFVTMGTRETCFLAQNLEGFKYRDGSKFLKKPELVRLDLEIGVVSDNSKEDLDLELRLGYS